jgi:hypothetical protein
MSGLKLKLIVNCLQPKLSFMFLLQDLHLVVTPPVQLQFTQMQLLVILFSQQQQFVRMLLPLQGHQISSSVGDVSAQLLEALNLPLLVDVILLQALKLPPQVEVIEVIHPRALHLLLQALQLPPQMINLLLQHLLSAYRLRRLLLVLPTWP